MTPTRKMIVQSGVLLAGGAALLLFSAARLSDSRAASVAASDRARECAALAARLGGAARGGVGPTTQTSRDGPPSPHSDVGDAVRAALSAAAVPESSFVGSIPDAGGASARVSLGDISLRQAIAFLYHLDAGDADTRVSASRLSRGAAGRWSLELTVVGRGTSGAGSDIVKAAWPAGREE